jgi:hypothetical protein
MVGSLLFHIGLSTMSFERRVLRIIATESPLYTASIQHVSSRNPLKIAGYRRAGFRLNNAAGMMAVDGQ